MNRTYVIVVTTVTIAAACGLAWISVLRLGATSTRDASDTPVSAAQIAAFSGRDEESIEVLFGRLTKKEQETVQALPDLDERAFTTRVFAYVDRMSGAEHESRFAVEAIERYLSPREARGRNQEYVDQLHAFISLGFLSRAEVQVGLPERHRTLVRGMCKKLAETRDEEIMLMTAAFLHATQARAELEPSLKVLFDSLKQNEMVEAELPIQIRVLEEARHARKK